jgi:hypothetical protein
MEVTTNENGGVGGGGWGCGWVCGCGGAQLDLSWAVDDVIVVFIVTELVLRESQG